MNEALENQLALSRLFAETLAPFNQYSNNKLALAKDELARRRELEDQAARSFQVREIEQQRAATQGLLARQDQAFRTAEHAAQRTFLSEQDATKAVSDRRNRIEEIEAYGAQRVLAIKESATAELKKQEELNKYEITQIEKRNELDKTARKLIRDEGVDRQTAEFWALDQEAKALQRTIVEGSTVPMAERNKIVRKVAERYTKNQEGLNKFLDPNSTTDISASLSRVLKQKDLAVAQQDISDEINKWMEPRLYQAEAARAILRDKLSLQRALIPNVDPRKLKEVGEKLKDLYEPPTDLGGGGPGAAGAPPSANDMFSAAATGRVSGVSSYGMGDLKESERNVSGATPVPAQAAAPSFVIPGRTGALPFLRDAASTAAGYHLVAPAAALASAPVFQAPRLLAGAARKGRDFLMGAPETPVTQPEMARIIELALADGMSEAQIKDTQYWIKAGDPEAIALFKKYRERALQSLAQDQLKVQPATNNVPVQVR